MRARNHSVVLISSLLAATTICAAPAESEFVYLARPGDTLISIAGQMLAQANDWPKLQSLNKIEDPKRLQPQQAIRIPIALLKQEPANATLLNSNGAVTFTHANTPAGANNLQAGSALPEQSQITTGQNGFVSVRLPDGSTLNIPPASTVQLEKLRRYQATPAYNTQVLVQQGRVETQVAKQAPSSRFNINSPLAIAGVRGTAFRVQFDPETKSTRTEVEEGKIGLSANTTPHSTKKIKTATPELNLTAGFGAIASPDGQLGQAIALLPAPQLNPAETTQERTTLRFRPNLPDGKTAARYKTQIAQDPAFTNVLIEHISPAAEVKLAAPEDGAYFLRIRGVDAQGLEGQTTQQPFIVAARPEPPLLQAPNNQAKVRNTQLTLQWAEVANARYRLQIAAAANPTQALIDVTSDTPQHVLAIPQQLPLGEYVWRVATLTTKQGPWGDLSSFKLLAPPAGVAPPEESATQLSFRWPSEPSQTFVAQIATEATFKQPLLERPLNEPTLTIPRPAAGTYYIRYRAIDADGFVGPFSAAQRFTVQLRWTTGDGSAVNGSANAISFSQ